MMNSKDLMQEALIKSYDFGFTEQDLASLPHKTGAKISLFTNNEDVYVTTENDVVHVPNYTRTSACMPLIFCDKADYTFGKYQKQFIEQMNAQTYSSNPDVQRVIDFLSGDYKASIEKCTGTSFDEWVGKLKGAAIVFQVDGEILCEKYLMETKLLCESETVMALDCITGKMAPCFTRPANKLYYTQVPLVSNGLECGNPMHIEGNSAMMMSEETEQRIIKTLDKLMKDNCIRIDCGSVTKYFLYWTKNTSAEDNIDICDLIAVSANGVERDLKDKTTNYSEKTVDDIRTRLQAIYKRVSPKTHHINGSVLFAEITRGCPGRQTYNFCKEISADELVHNIDMFFTDAKLEVVGNFASEYYTAFDYASCAYRGLNLDEGSKARRNFYKRSIIKSIICGTPIATEIIKRVYSRLGPVQSDLVNQKQASLIKVIYNRNARLKNKKEITSMLDENNKSQYYNLGRILALAEYAQKVVNPTVQQSIATANASKLSHGSKSTFVLISHRMMDYFGQMRGRKKESARVYLEKIRDSIMDNFDAENIAKPSSDDIALFYLGYTHQHSAFYKKKTILPDEN